MSWVLGTLKRSLGARTVALLWLDDSTSGGLRLKEIASDADEVTERTRLGAAGIVGAVVRDRQAVIVGATKAGQLPYYDGGRAGVALVAVPIIESGHLRGILAFEGLYGDESLPSDGLRGAIDEPRLGAGFERESTAFSELSELQVADIARCDAFAGNVPFRHQVGAKQGGISPEKPLVIRSIRDFLKIETLDRITGLAVGLAQ